MGHPRWRIVMSKNTYIFRRNSSYYIRIIVPSDLYPVFGAKHLRRSLHTHNYQEALDRAPKMLYTIKRCIKLARYLKMDIQEGRLILDNTDINRIVKNHLEKFDEILNDNFEEIIAQTYNKNDSAIFPESKFQQIKIENPSYTKEDFKFDCLKNEVTNYLSEIKDDRKTKNTTLKIIERAEAGKIEVLNKDNPQPWQKQLLTALTTLNRYISEKLESIEKNEHFNKASPPRIYNALEAINSEKSQDILNATQTRTPWEKVFNEFEEYKNGNKGTKQNTIDSNRFCVLTCFELVNKKYVEEITYKDCHKIANTICRVPVKWNINYPHKRLQDLIKQDFEKTLSATSVKKYLRSFKEFMAFCRKRRYTTESFVDDIDIPRKREATEINGFTPKELSKIFNIKTYPPMVSIEHSYRYWIPLIALYSGMRLNEICQLYLDDIDWEDDVYYFNLTDKRKDQHLKNRQSKRRVPIHPMLIEFGILNLIKKARKEKRERLFYQLTYNEKNHYANKMSGWFARYLKSLGIEGRDKVFHSFRHTVKPYLRDAGISQEYQNAICGWGTNDIGEKVYGGQIPIAKLYEEISKLKYPFLEKNLNAIMKKNKGRI